MPEVISQQDWQKLPEEARREVLDFFSFIKAKYSATKKPDTAMLSEQSLAEDWLKPEEEEAWSRFQ